MKTKAKRTITRREMIRATGLTVAASGTMIDGIQALTSLGLQPTPGKGTAVPPPSSLFLSCQPLGKDEDGPGKYKSGDAQAVLPLVAFWLMVTTDNWDGCFDKPGWIEQLVAEFARENTKLADPSVQKALAVTMGKIWGELKTASKNTELVSIRTTFRNYSNIAALYGGRPCPGGGTILDIVGLVPKTRH
jgi:hypothetical protein